MPAAFQLASDQQYGKLLVLLLDGQRIDDLPDVHGQIICDMQEMLDEWEGFVESEGFRPTINTFAQICECLGIIERMMRT